MIEMLYVLLLEIILITCIGCRYAQVDECDHQLAVELSRAAANKSHTLCADLTFPREVEDMYCEHGLLLSDIIARVPQAPFAATMRSMARNSLQELFQKVKPEIDILCSSQDVQYIFQTIHQQAQQKIPFNKRAQSWAVFMTNLASAQNNMRNFQLSPVWFPLRADKDNEKKFIFKNAHLMLNKGQEKYLMADTIITFLPLALMARYDPEVFAATRLMQAR